MDDLISILGKGDTLKSILERWILAHINGISSIKEIDKLLVEECNRKNIQCNKKKLEKLHAVMSNKPQIKGSLTSIDPERYKKLLEMSSEEDILKSYLKYQTLIPGGQQWSVPKKVYDYMIDNFDLKLEAFASPFNSQLIFRGLRYCSVFPIIDKPFGSMGSFFKYNLNQEEENTICLNPPFILDILEATIKKCLSVIEEMNSIRMIFILPNWSDAVHYKTLKSSKYLVYFKLLEPRKYEFTLNDQPKSPRANLLFVVLSKGDHKGNVEDIASYWCNNE